MGSRGKQHEHDMLASLAEQTYKDGRPLTDIEMAHIMFVLPSRPFFLYTTDRSGF